MSLHTLQIVSPVIIVAAGLSFIGLERLFPYNRGQSVFRDGFWVDLLGYGVGQSYVMGLVLSAFIYWFDHQTGLSRLHLVSRWPIAWQVVFFIVWHDFNTYCIHRLQHGSRYLWRTHEAHHACTAVDWLSGIRSNSLEILIYQTVEYLPVVVLGADPVVPLYKGMANAIYGMYIHSNLNWRMGRLLRVFNGPELHRWHHANDDVAAYNRNFATKFSLWDRWFGTLFDPQDRRATLYGPDDPHFPQGYFSQHWYAFRPFAPPVAASPSPAAS
jgi:sterol desaturase/sphingolipid hydroxylase (fatty acid hydroxylase superfamily)